jgi:hypothetical protein
MEAGYGLDDVELARRVTGILHAEMVRALDGRLAELRERSVTR